MTRQRWSRSLAAALALSPLTVAPSAARAGQPAPVGRCEALPPAALVGSRSLEETLAGRRSARSFGPRELSLPEIAQLSWAAQGISEATRGLRTAPSAGALYPLELYLVRRQGTDRYDPLEHCLRRVRSGDLRTPVARASFGQAEIKEAPAIFVVAAVPARTAVKYGARTERYVALEAGHAAQNLLLQATALGLSGVTIGAFDDAQVGRVLGLDAGRSVYYLIPVGAPAAPP